MIPIRDTIRSNNFPLITTLIIGLNVLAFLWELLEGPHLNEFLFRYGMVPARYSDPAFSVRFTGVEQITPFLTSIFLHGGFLHLLGNMWFLHIFGDNVEDRLGHLRYLVFYLLCGVLAGLAHLLINWTSEVPTIGASGAISGVMGAYLLLHPNSKIVTVIPIFLFFQFVEIPAFVFLGLWFLMQLFSAGFTPSGAGGVAWWAHIGGFAMGMLLLKLMQSIPSTRAERGIRRRTERRSTHRFQDFSPRYSSEDLDVHGWIMITPEEAYYGSRKLISVSQGFRKKTILVRVPPGTGGGTRLRLAGLGKRNAEGRVGDLYLEVRVRGEEG